MEGPDGLRTVRSFTFPNETTVTETVLSGKPDPTDADGVIKGTRTVIVQKLSETVISKKTYDIETGVMLGSTVYSDFDADDRAKHVDYLNGTYSTMTYSCCGLESVVNSDGTETHYTYDSKKRVETETRYFGSSKYVTLVYHYDAANNVKQVTRSWNGELPVVVSASSYDLANRITSTADILGLPTGYEYTSIDGQRLVTVTYPNQSISATLYNVDGSIARTTGTAVVPVAFESGVETVDGYSRAYQKKMAINDNGAPTGLWTKTYTDGAVRLYKTVDSAGLATTPHYNSLGQLTRLTAPNNVTSLITFDDLGRAEYDSFDTTGDGTLHLDGEDPVKRIKTSVSANDALAGETVVLTQKYVWPEQGIDASRLTEEFRVSLDGLRTWSTVYHNSNPITVRTVTVIDDVNDITTSTSFSPLSGCYSVRVFKYGNLVEEKDYDADVMVSRKVCGYDSRNRLYTITDERNGATTYGYDDYDRLQTVTSPPPATGQPPLVTTYQYDEFGRQWKTVLPDNTYTIKAFDNAGRVVMVSGSQTYRTGYGYDLWGRLTTMTNWTDYPNGAQVNKWIYDDTSGRLLHRYYPDKTTGNPSTKGLTYGYNDIGQLETVTSARGILTTKFYDDWGRNWKTTFSGGSVATPDLVTTFNRLNLPETIAYGDQSMDYVYDWLGSATKETYTGGPLDNIEIDRAFNQYHQPQQTTATNGQTELARTEYLFSKPVIGRGGPADPYTHARIQAIYNGTRRAIFAYEDNSSLITSIHFVNGDIAFPGTRTMVYDKLNRLTSISTAGESHTYEYNLLSKRTKDTLSDGSHWNYGYDALGQLESAVRKFPGDIPSINENHSFVSDQVGNLTSATSASEAAGVTRSFAPNAINQITAKPNSDYITLIGKANPAASLQVVGHSSTVDRQGELFNIDVNVPTMATPQYVDLTVEATLPPIPPLPAVIDANTVSKYVPAGSSETLSYDDDGNLISDGRWTYFWDAMNRLVKMVSLTDVPASQRIQLDYTYDALGRRIAAEGSHTPLAGEQSDEALPHQVFVYDGWKLFAEKGWGSKAKNNTYTWLNNELIMLTMDGTEYAVSTDGRGNITKLHGQSSPYATAVYEYEPYGKLIRATAENAIGDKVFKNPFRFSSEYYDDVTGLIYYGHRYYSPDSKRWLNRDPIDIQGGVNLYGFVGNDPINRWDLLGLQSQIYSKGMANCPVLATAPTGNLQNLGQFIGPPVPPPQPPKIDIGAAAKELGADSKGAVGWALDKAGNSVVHVNTWSWNAAAGVSGLVGDWGQHNGIGNFTFGVTSFLEKQGRDSDSFLNPYGKAGYYDLGKGKLASQADILLDLAALLYGAGELEAGVLLNDAEKLSVVTCGDAGVITPRINIADQFYFNGTSYEFGDPATHGLSATVKEGILGFDIKRDTERLESGTDMFASLMQRLETDGVKVNGIQGYWIPDTESVNYIQYMNNLQSMDPANAALNTWTGRMAGRYGFKTVTFDKGFNNTIVVTFGP